METPGENRGLPRKSQVQEERKGLERRPRDQPWQGRALLPVAAGEGGQVAGAVVRGEDRGWQVRGKDQESRGPTC